MKRIVNLLIVDDQVIYRNGIRFTLENQMSFISNIHEATNGAEAIDMIHKNNYDIVLLDIQMPKMDGVSTIKHLRDSRNNIPVLVISAYNDELLVKQILERGSNGFIMKDSGTEELVKAINVILDGGKYFANSITQVLLGNKNKKSISSGLDSELTKREFQVLKLIAEELNHDEIADKLHISRRTVEGHKKNLTSKLYVKGSVGLVKYAMNHAII